MKKFLCVLFAACYSATLLSLSPPLLKEKVTFQPIHSLLTSQPPKEAVWIQGKVIGQEEDVVYVLADDTNAIRIFLCLDELAQFTLTPDEHIAVWGKVDKSPLGGSRNEFYVEKIFEIPATTTTPTT